MQHNTQRYTLQETKMNALFRILVMTFGVTFFPLVIAMEVNTDHSMVFQVIQDQMVFDNSTVESATIAVPKSAADSYGIHLKLNTIAAKKFSDLTQKNIGKQANIMLNEKVVSSTTIQSKLGGEFFVTGLTQEQANQFIKKYMALIAFVSSSSKTNQAL
jgi:hypothetical protein